MTLDEKQIDAITEIINIGIGKGAAILNTMLHSHIHLNVPQVNVLLPDELIHEMKKYGENNLAVVDLSFQGSFTGNANLVFPEESASRLVKACTGEEDCDSDMDSLRAGTLREIGNIVINAVIGSISNILKASLMYTVPSYKEGKAEGLYKQKIISHSTFILHALTRFNIEKLDIEGDIVLFFRVESLDKFLSAIDDFIAIME